MQQIYSWISYFDSLHSITKGNFYALLEVKHSKKCYPYIFSHSTVQSSLPVFTHITEEGKQLNVKINLHGTTVLPPRFQGFRARESAEAVGELNNAIKSATKVRGTRCDEKRPFELDFTRVPARELSRDETKGEKVVCFVRV